MNKQIERRLHKEAEKRYPFDVKDGLYGKPERVGMYNENEIFRKGAEFMFNLLLDRSCKYWGQFQYSTEGYRKAMEEER